MPAPQTESFDCQSCGACCAYSADWPRFALESEARIARIPERFRDDDRGRMRCDGNRCSALTGAVRRHVACAIYELRPDVCRDCQPGDDACREARAFYGLDQQVIIICHGQARPGHPRLC